MKQTHSSKAAEELINAASRLDYNPYLFAGALREAPHYVQIRIVDGMVAYLKGMKRDSQNPHLSYRVHPPAAEIASEIDLTEFDTN